MSKKVINEKNRGEILIYKTSGKGVGLKVRLDNETIWLSLNQIAELFGRDNSVVSRHIKNILKAGELSEKATVAKIATVQREGKRKITRDIEYYNLDVIISVGYRVDSKQATQFRIWATKILKQHLVAGYTINKDRIAQNYEKFLQAVSDVKALLPKNNEVKVEEVLELVNAFADTWFSLDAYDSEEFPKKGVTRKQASFTAEELNLAIFSFKKELMIKKQATELFAQEKNAGAVAGIVGNVLQAFGGKDLYPTLEEKAAHLLYFMVKNHPFTDGNKRSGAFAFVWFLHRFEILHASLTPEALTALTLLIAESNPKDKDRMVGVVLLMLRSKK